MALWSKLKSKSGWNLQRDTLLDVEPFFGAINASMGSVNHPMTVHQLPCADFYLVNLMQVIVREGLAYRASHETGHAIEVETPWHVRLLGSRGSGTGSRLRPDIHLGAPY